MNEPEETEGVITSEEVKEPVIEPGTPEPQVEPEPQGPRPTQDPLEIARRIELGKRKAAEKRAEEAERRAIAAEERARLLAEQKAEEKKQEKIYSPEEVQAMIDAGSLKPAVGYAYLARVEAERVNAESETKRRQLEPLTRAQQEIAEYVKYIPALADSSSEGYRRAALEFDDLVRQGFPNDDRTRRAALKMAHGDLETIKRKADLQSYSRTPSVMPADSSGNGGRSQPGKVDVSKAPPSLVRLWEKTGITDPEARARQFKNYLEAKAK